MAMSDSFLDAAGLPLPGSEWRHRSGRIYVILMITNVDTQRSDFPVTVVFQGPNGKRWSTSVSKFREQAKPNV